MKTMHDAYMETLLVFGKPPVYADYDSKSSKDISRYLINRGRYYGQVEEFWTKRGWAGEFSLWCFEQWLSKQVKEVT